MWLSIRSTLRSQQIFSHAFDPFVNPLLFILDLRLNALMAACRLIRKFLAILLQLPEVLNRGCAAVQVTDRIRWLCDSLSAIRWIMWTLHRVAMTNERRERARSLSTEWNIEIL